MASRRSPPLTPEMSDYLGMDEHEIHKLRWRSQSRDGVAHTTTGATAEAGYCTCEAFRWSLVGDGPVGCKHARCWSDALAYHLGPPAEPGGAARARPAPIGGYDDRAAAALDRAPNALDAAVAAGGDRWLVSRTPPRVTLTCASCAGTYRFDGEDQARRFVALALPCDQCGSVAGPPPPAPGAARRPLQDHLDTLYGDLARDEATLRRGYPTDEVERIPGAS